VPLDTQETLLPALAGHFQKGMAHCARATEARSHGAGTRCLSWSRSGHARGKSVGSVADQRVSPRCARVHKPLRPGSESNSQPYLMMTVESVSAARFVKEIRRALAAVDNIYHAAARRQRDEIHIYPQSNTTGLMRRVPIGNPPESFAAWFQAR